MNFHTQRRKIVSIDYLYLISIFPKRVGGRLTVANIPQVHAFRFWPEKIIYIMNSTRSVQLMTSFWHLIIYTSTYKLQVLDRLLGYSPNLRKNNNRYDSTAVSMAVPTIKILTGVGDEGMTYPHERVASYATIHRQLLRCVAKRAWCQIPYTMPTLPEVCSISFCVAVLFSYFQLFQDFSWT